MLDFKGISVHYGHQDVLTGVTFRVNKGERVGVVGPNGSGKSTLFKIVLGEMASDSGELVIEGSPRIGWTRQNPEPDSDGETLLEYSLRGIPGLAEMEAEMQELESDLADPAKMRRYGELQAQFEHLGGYDIETRVKIALGGLGFSTDEFDKPFKSFSGGWRMRAELSRVLASNPDLLLLDEPSNYLDLPAVEWLQKFLKAYEGTLMLISHDRYLLRTLTGIIVEVDAGTATRYEGGLDWYLNEREVRYEHLKAAKENQDRHREQLQRFVDRFRAQATKAAQAQSRQKIIDKLDEERIVLPKRYTQSGRLRLAEPPPSGVEMFRCEDLGFSYDGVKNVFEGLSFQITRGDKVALIGYNGLGKTTLMRIIAGTRRPTTGKAVLGHNVVPGYLSQEFAETIPQREERLGRRRRRSREELPQPARRVRIRRERHREARGCSFRRREDTTCVPPPFHFGSEFPPPRRTDDAPRPRRTPPAPGRDSQVHRNRTSGVARHRLCQGYCDVHTRDHARGHTPVSGRIRLLLREEGADGQRRRTRNGQWGNGCRLSSVEFRRRFIRRGGAFPEGHQEAARGRACESRAEDARA